MSQSQIMTGARARLIIDGKVKGIFTDCSWGMPLSAEPAHILGAYAPVEITYTAAEAIQINCRGWRIVGFGPHKEGLVPSLSQLLTHNAITLSVMDRQTGRNIMTVVHCRPVGYQSGVAARQQSEISQAFIGLRIHDEDTTNAEPDASKLPS